MPEPRSTGLSGLDAQHDFMRARRRATIAKLVARLRGEPDDVGVVLPYEEVIEALGFVSERSAGLKVVPLDQIVGSVGRGRDFDRRFRPTSGRSRGRWEQIAAAARRGESFPPVDLVKVGELYFVRDGHHRVSVARALGRTDIDAHVTEVVTRIDPDRAMKLSDLPLKSHERVFFERVPLAPEARREIALSDPWDYAVLAEAVEAWGFRAMQSRGEALDREQTAQPLARDRVPPGGRDAARGRPRARLHRDRGLSERGRGALPAAAHPRLERRGPPARDRGSEPPAPLARLRCARLAGPAPRFASLAAQCPHHPRLRAPGRAAPTRPACRPGSGASS